MEYSTALENNSPVDAELANGSKPTATNLGRVLVNVKEKVRLLCKVFYIPAIKLNWFSFSRSDDYGVTATIQSGKCNLIDWHDRKEILGILSKQKRDDLFTAQIMVPKEELDQCNHAGFSSHVRVTRSSVKSDKVTEELRHKRMGKANTPVIRNMIIAGRYWMSTQEKCDPSSVKLLLGQRAQRLHVMEYWWIRGWFKKITIHMDICGAIKHATSQGMGCFAVIVASLQRCIWAQLLKKRRKVHDYYLDFIVWLHWNTQKKVTCVRGGNAPAFFTLWNSLNKNEMVLTT